MPRAPSCRRARPRARRARCRRDRRGPRAASARTIRRAPSREARRPAITPGGDGDDGESRARPTPGPCSTRRWCAERRRGARRGAQERVHREARRAARRTGPRAAIASTGAPMPATMFHGNGQTTKPHSASDANGDQLAHEVRARSRAEQRRSRAGARAGIRRGGCEANRRHGFQSTARAGRPAAAAPNGEPDPPRLDRWRIRVAAGPASSRPGGCRRRPPRRRRSRARRRGRRRGHRPSAGPVTGSSGRRSASAAVSGSSVAVAAEFESAAESSAVVSAAGVSAAGGVLSRTGLTRSAFAGTAAGSSEAGRRGVGRPGRWRSAPAPASPMPGSVAAGGRPRSGRPARVAGRRGWPRPESASWPGGATTGVSGAAIRNAATDAGAGAEECSCTRELLVRSTTRGGGLRGSVGDSLPRPGSHDGGPAVASPATAVTLASGPPTGLPAVARDGGPPHGRGRQRPRMS